ncbi:MAG: MaoC family dehydratase [Acidobacteriota bacterium]|nr:MaoC family dehydratase [Acidobacteriota bacterium]
MSEPQTASNGPFVGKELSTHSFGVDDALVDDYYDGLDLPRSAGGPLPSTLGSEPDGNFFSEIAFPNHTGHLWMRQGWSISAPLVLGTQYSVGGSIREIYPKRNRNVVLYEVTLTDPNGKVVLTTAHHQSFLSDQTYSGSVELRDPSTKPGARIFEVPEGEAFGGLERTISLEMCGQYFHGNASYHTDKAASEELGFRDVVVGGRMTMAYAAHILEERFGDAWFAGGRFDLKFTNPTWAGDTVVARGVVTGPDEEEPDRLGGFVWLAKPDDTVVLIARASVPA